ncbi:MAG: hypothetical protein ACYCVY_06100 [Acidiferrobacteraceae bacterium]|jgi:hypothetical protein
MNHIIALEEISNRFQQTAEELVAAYAKQGPVSSDQVAPPQLVEALRQFLVIAAKLDLEQGRSGAVVGDDVDGLGDHALSVTADLVAWTQQLEIKTLQREFGKLAIAIADWVIRHRGHLRTLELVVNALADMANSVQAADSLRRMGQFMGEVIHATDEVIKQDLEKNNPGRPWRLINLNRGIVAARSHDLQMMEEVFDDIIRYLPEDAGAFFEEGMQQMEALDYPAPVREVMARYFSAWTQHRMH